MKKRKNSVKIILVVIIIIFAISFGGYFIVNKNKTYPQIASDGTSENFVETNDSIIEEYKAKLVGTGDALIHSPIYKAAYNSSTDTYDFNYMLKYVKDEIKEYDIKYYNQEVIFDDDKPYSSYPIFNAPSDWGKNMISDVGFNLVSLATNHSMDGGNKSAKKNAEWWESHEEVLATGMASTEEKRNEHKIAEANGITYTMLSYTYGTNGMPVTEDYTVNIYDKETVLKDIKAVRDKVDVLIVAMHWGTEYNTEITEIQKEQAKFLGENGVDIILGNHPHCIEPWEWIDDDTVVFYSFGNLISNQMSAENPIVKKVGPVGMLGTLEITKRVDKEKNTSEIKIDNIGAEILYTYRYYNNEKGQNDYLVIPFSKMKSEYLYNYEDVYNEFSEILKKFDDNITIAQLPEYL